MKKVVYGEDRWGNPTVATVDVVEAAVVKSPLRKPVEPIKSYRLEHTWDRQPDGTRKARRCRYGCMVCEPGRH